MLPLILSAHPSRHAPEWRPDFNGTPWRPDVYRGMGQVPLRVHRHAREWRPNLGQTQTQLAQQAAGYAGTAATTVTSLLATIGTVSAATVPLVGAVVAAGTLLANVLIKVFSGCGQSCTLTSDEANEVEQALQQNLAAYLAIPNGQRTQAIQAAALANFDNAWAQLVKYCGSGSFGQAGQNCISDRESGSCAYKTSPGGWQQQNGEWIYVYPGANGSGTACWNWTIGYRDPIANDPTVVPNAAGTSTSAATSATNQTFEATTGMSSTATLNLAPLLIIGAIVVGALVLL